MDVAATEETRKGLADTELLGGMRAGNPAAFAALMRSNNQRLYRLARGFLRDDLEAEEAVHAGYDSPLTKAPTTPEQVTARREIRNAIEEAVNGLPPHFRS